MTSQKLNNGLLQFEGTIGSNGQTGFAFSFHHDVLIHFTGFNQGCTLRTKYEYCGFTATYCDCRIFQYMKGPISLFSITCYTVTPKYDTLKSFTLKGDSHLLIKAVYILFFFKFSLLLSLFCSLSTVTMHVNKGLPYLNLNRIPM